MKKEVFILKQAIKELNQAPIEVRRVFERYFKILSKRGYISYPDSKKLSDTLYEIRVRVSESWRAFYVYVEGNKIIVLRVFRKQTQHTPKAEIKIAISRINNL